ncbi:MAG: radical SAM family heme chaperone HemW [Oscillospiraceae bacterium]|jgi:oxygen-independent coproporphyrinogen-3 oxidase|nr:radical SAM family heme chaperone HemW [Oscillospiraceae bacterium]
MSVHGPREIFRTGPNAEERIGVYIHIPFCVRKCAYCDFYSLPSDDVPKRFVDALIREIGMAAERFGRANVSTIYLGGGTPSLLKPEDLDAIIRAVRGGFDVDGDCELTLEANPGTIDADKLTAYSRAGVNRLSIGAQASQDRLLALLGRIHRWDDVTRAAQDARLAGIDNLSVDLIYAIPTQTPNDWRGSLNGIVDLDARHVSCYELTLEPGTVMYNIYKSIDESIALDMQCDTLRILGGAGISRYEISNYAKPGSSSRHNEGYWLRRPYLGFGPGAHSLWDAERFANPSSLDDWLGKIESGEAAWSITETLTRSDAAFETMMLGLRMVKGVSLPLFHSEYGATPFSLWGGALEEMRRVGWMDWDSERIWLTPFGLDVHNAVCGMLL